MSATRYHLVCEGFRSAHVNKTQLSLALKQQLSLTDTQLADLMASRRTVLARNLVREKARLLGQKLSRAGLSVKVESADANQKLSADELRQHLLDGGLSHYFAGRYHHPEEDLETRLSLVILAALPAVCYLLLPLIGLLLLLPLTDPAVWAGQTIAAATQGVIAAALLIPAILLWPRTRARAGLPLEPDTESLLFQLTDEIGHYIHAPQVASIRLTPAPFIRLRQGPRQWLRRQTDLEVGLPYLEAVTLQQFAGDLAQQLAPQAPPLYAWTWGAFTLWHRALSNRLPSLARRLDGWIQPMREHQQQRSQDMVRALVGHREARHISQVQQRLAPVVGQWEAFQRFCEHLDVTPRDWQGWMGRSLPAVETPADDEESVGQFRMTVPASWALSNPTGYHKAIGRLGPGRRFEETALKLWRQFLVFRQTEERFAELGIPATALIPPTEQPGSGQPRPRTLVRLYRLTMATQRQSVRHALGLAGKAPKQDLAALSRAWRKAALPFWPTDTLGHRNLALARTLYLAFQGAEQLNLWARQEPRDEKAQALRDRQLVTFFRHWTHQIHRLPGLPLLSDSPASLKQQLLKGWEQPDQASAADIAERAQSWVNTLQIYWTLVAASLLNSEAHKEAEKAAA